MWRDSELHTPGESVKHIRHPRLGLMAFEPSSFAIDGRPELSMIVYNPVNPADLERIGALMAPRRV